MRSLFFLLLCVMAFAVFSASNVGAQTGRRSVSGTEVTGTFRMNFKGKFKRFSNSVKIQALGGGKIRFAFDLVYPYAMQNGEPMVNMGMLDDEANIEGDTAIYSSNDGKCRITFKFVRPGTLRVTQSGSDGECGFGHNVSSDGAYKKFSGKKPKFEEN